MEVLDIVLIIIFAVNIIMSIVNSNLIATLGWLCAVLMLMRAMAI